MTLFWVTVPFSVLYYATTIYAAREAGYTELYDPEFRAASSAGLMGLVQQAHLLHGVAFLALLATFPSLKRAAGPIIVTLGLLALSLATGARSGFIIGILVLLCYAATRNVVTPTEPWIRSRGVIATLAASPAVIGLMVMVERSRGVGAEFAGSASNTLLQFLYSQGVSSTVIYNAYAYREALPEQGYLLHFMHTGVLARLAGIEVMHGNSLENALSGASLAHSLGYVVLGDSYLAGRGTGSSFLAEAHLDLGYGGVALVGLAYGLLLALLSRLSPERFVTNLALLLVAESLFWAPRGSASGFISSLFAPSTILGLVAIIALAGLFDAQRPTRERLRPASARQLGGLL